MTNHINEKILEALRAELNAQTAQFPWAELQRYYASGSVIGVAAGLDLVDVAARIAADDKSSVEQWMKTGLINKVTDDQAAQWHAENVLLWTVVVKPWILVQQNKPASLH